MKLETLVVCISFETCGDSDGVFEYGRRVRWQLNEDAAEAVRKTEGEHLAQLAAICAAFDRAAAEIDPAALRRISLVATYTVGGRPGSLGLTQDLTEVPQ